MKLSDYIRGFRKGKEAHRLEKEAMRDPFLADALEGYSRVESGADEQIELLRRRVNMRVTQKRRHTIAWSVAASLLIGVCIGSYFLLQENTLPDEWKKYLTWNLCLYKRKKRKRIWWRR